MELQENMNEFFIWGIDDSPYGPVELPVLIDWISDERVLADTWIFARRDGSWQRAAEIPGLQAYFSQTNIPDSTASDRKSTRLNSSHLGISYAVFCLKKKQQ